MVPFESVRIKLTVFVYISDKSSRPRYVTISNAMSLFVRLALSTALQESNRSWSNGGNGRSSPCRSGERISLRLTTTNQHSTVP